MTEPLIIVNWDDYGHRTVRQWDSYDDLADEYWREWVERGDLPGAEWPEDSPANELVDEIVVRHAVDVMRLIEALVKRAPDDDSLRLLGAGLLEYLVRDDRSDDELIDQIARIAAVDARFRLALSGGWIGQDLDMARERRLLALGLTYPGERRAEE